MPKSVAFVVLLLTGTGCIQPALPAEPTTSTHTMNQADDPGDESIVRFIEATGGEFTVGSVKLAVDKVFASFDEREAKGLPEFLANIAALDLSSDAIVALRSRLLAVIEASPLPPNAKADARALVIAPPPALIGRATMPYDGVCDGKERMIDPDCPPLITGPAD